MSNSKARLLICEDDIPTLALLQKTFEMAGCEVDTATTGTVALYKLRANNYDLVVMDYHMPLKDAQDTMTELSKEGSDSTPKILISAEDRSADAAKLGFEAFYAKPVTPDIAETIIKTHVR